MLLRFKKGEQKRIRMFNNTVWYSFAHKTKKGNIQCISGRNDLISDRVTSVESCCEELGDAVRIWASVVYDFSDSILKIWSFNNKTALFLREMSVYNPDIGKIGLVLKSNNSILTTFPLKAEEEKEFSQQEINDLWGEVKSSIFEKEIAYSYIRIQNNKKMEIENYIKVIEDINNFYLEKYERNLDF